MSVVKFYRGDPNAPKPTMGAHLGSNAIITCKGKLLLEKRRDSDVWGLPGGGVKNYEEPIQAMVREVREELGWPLALEGVRPSVTVNFEGGFDDFFLVQREIGLAELTLQKEEVSAVRWAAREEVLTLLAEGKFVSYPESFLHFLFDMRSQFGFVTK